MIVRRAQAWLGLLLGLAACTTDVELGRRDADQTGVPDAAFIDDGRLEPVDGPSLDAPELDAGLPDAPSD